VSGVFVSTCGDHGSRGWYDNPQPVLRRVFTAAQCAIPCVQSVCMYGWCARCSYCHSDSECVSVSLCAVYIYSVQPGCKFLYMLGVCILCPTCTDRPKPTRHPSKVIASWCYGDPTRCARPSIYLLSDSQHSLQLRRYYS